MNKIFKFKGGLVVDPIQHTIDVLKLHDDVTIYIGTDSQDRSRNSVFATAIAYRYGNKGVHYIYSREHLKRFPSMWSRLYKETELTIEVATWFLSHFPNLNIILDFDYNVKPNSKSNSLVSLATGWSDALGLKSNIKLDCTNNFLNYQMQVATRAADRECRGGCNYKL